MPQYLRKDSMRLLEASMESLALALVGLGLPSRREFREPGCQYAATIGLIGTAAELAMSAILVQTYGPDILLKHDHKYKAGREILDDTRSLLKNPVPRTSFLTAGVSDEKKHRDGLFACTTGFVVLCRERAAGLHAGNGPSREVVCVAAQKVYDFLKELANSTRIKPYLLDLPVPPQRPLSPNVLIEDLLNQLHQAKGVQDRAILIGSIYLVLPEIPAVEPEWIEALDRVAIVPEEKDLALLLTTLERAYPMQFQRLSAGAAPVGVVVRPDDPHALPIAPHQLRRSFAGISDQFFADIGSANTRLDAGILDLPPDDFLMDLAVLGPDGVKAFLSRGALTAHEAWAFVAAAINTQGTQGPFWFLVRITDDLSQLATILQRAMRLSKRKKTKERHEVFRKGVTAIRGEKPMPKKTALSGEIADQQLAAESKREKLVEAAVRNGTGDLGVSAEGGSAIVKISAGELSIGQGMTTVLESAIKPKGKPYWAKMLCEAASEPDDLRSVVGVLNDPDLSTAHTAARKAVRLIDVSTFGPPMDLNTP